MKLAPPASNNSEANQYYPYRANQRGSKRVKTVVSSYRKQLLFGDLKDIKAQTFVILEPNHDTHNMLFQNRGMDDVIVGCRFCIRSPYAVGTLKSGSIIIQTDRPLVLINQPDVPERPLRINQVKDTLKFINSKKWH